MREVDHGRQDSGRYRDNDRAVCGRLLARISGRADGHAGSVTCGYRVGDEHRADDPGGASVGLTAPALRRSDLAGGSGCHSQRAREG
jgi:hypothetical protein